MVAYRLSNGFARTLGPPTAPGNALDGRFDVQVNQSLPFRELQQRSLEMLFAVRNFFHDGAWRPVAVRRTVCGAAPTRVVGGVTLHFWTRHAHAASPIIRIRRADNPDPAIFRAIQRTSRSNSTPKPHTMWEVAVSSARIAERLLRTRHIGHFHEPVGARTMRSLNNLRNQAAAVVALAGVGATAVGRAGCDGADGAGHCQRPMRAQWHEVEDGVFWEHAVTV